MLDYVWLIPFFPALGVVINGLLGSRYIKDRAHWVGVTSVALSLAVTLVVAYQAIFHGLRGTNTLFTWVVAGDFRVEASFLIDPMSVIMLLVVAGVGFIVHVYSIGYMHGDPGYPRFFAELNLFMFSMLILVMADNYFLMFLGWEGVGLCSYLLIGFWYERKSAADAGKKAFIVNRIGDAGFLVGVFMIWTTFGSLNYKEVFGNVAGVEGAAITAICLLLFTGAVGKSAQLPLFTWLPDAMEGPTPVSALIHAATMVTAGVYMVARSSALFIGSPTAMGVVAVVGALTAIFAASIGLAQNDIKRVLAYSTVSQLGYMFLATGVGAFAVGIFHLLTHAFFKGLLFLASGSVIHALSGEQDMRRMGALRPHLPRTAVTFYIGALAIAGIPPFAGFWSKDEILAHTFKSGHYVLWVMGVVAALMTAFYMFRLIYMTFYGQDRVTEHAKAHLHESPGIMTWPLITLAILSVVGGIIPGFPPEGGWIHRFLSESIAGGYGAEGGHAGGSTLVSLAHAAEANGGGEIHFLGLTPLDWGLTLLSVGVGVTGWLLARYAYTINFEFPGKVSRA
ncbi:MAG: NADH-quinone oxidoreductase subunit L, partial [Nitrospinota bacterium]